MSVGTRPRHVLGRSRIQSKENRVTLPVVVRDLGIFRGDGSKEIAHWGYDEENGHIIFWNGLQVNKPKRVEFIGHTTVGSNRLLQIPKQSFPDYAARESPVNEDARLKYGQVVYVVGDSPLDSNVLRLIPRENFDKDLLNSGSGEGGDSDEDSDDGWDDYSS